MHFDSDNRPTYRQIMKFTGVTERTARRWLRHGTHPYIVEFISIKQRGRILPESWPRHWRFNHHELFETEGCHPAISWQQLTWFSYVTIGWYQSMRVIPKIKASIDYLIEKLPRADVIQLEAYRQQLDELQQRSEISPAEVVSHVMGNAPDREKSRQSGC